MPDSVRDVISSSGQSLDASVQRAVEDQMGDSFGDVRIHAGPNAANACEDINARAFTVANHIAFNSGEYDPESPEGQHLLAHELAHVRQQPGGANGVRAAGGASGRNGVTTREPGGALSMMPQEGVELEIDPDPQLEREAEETAERVMTGEEVGIQRLKDTEIHVQRLSEDANETLRELQEKYEFSTLTEEDVREIIENIPFDLDDLDEPERIRQLFQEGSHQQDSHAELLIVVKTLFEHVRKVEGETDPRRKGSLLPVAGENEEQALLSLADGITVETIHHELGHALADSYGYGFRAKSHT
nr:DUF4157 domain-containing protein [Halovivax cerinus]